MSTDAFEPSFPVHYGRSRLASALYLVEDRLFEALLPKGPLHAVRLGSRGLVSVTWFDYEDSALGPYQELSVGIVVDTQRNLLGTSWNALRAAPTLGTYVLTLPLSNEEARRAGVEHLGLPKVLMDLPLSWSKDHLHATAHQGDRSILSMDVPLRRGLSTVVPRLTVYSRLEHRLLRTVVETDLTIQMDFVGRPRLRLDAPDHPVCATFSALGLPSARCLALFHGTIQSAQLLAPETL